MLIYESHYKNIASIVMESSQLRVTILPESGGKIQSIFNKIEGNELLIQSQNAEFKRSDYDTSFSDGDQSGFDEVFPTIEACRYPTAPWSGINIPDHGEVWTLPWAAERHEDHVTLTVDGVRFPYQLKKKIEFQQENCLKISYSVANRSDFPFSYIWAPHILFAREEDFEVCLPAAVKTVMSTCNLDNKLGGFGTMHTWPTTVVDDAAYPISKTYPMYPGKCEKYYAMDTLDEGWCALFNPKTGSAVGLSFPVSDVPYLGIWDGFIGDQCATALEPCTGAFDDLGVANLWRRVQSVEGKSTRAWYLTLTVDTVKSVEGIDAAGNFKCQK